MLIYVLLIYCFFEMSFSTALHPRQRNGRSYHRFRTHVSSFTPDSPWAIRTDLFRIVDARALVRLQVDHVNRALVPAFYRYLQAQEEGKYSDAWV